MKVGQKYGKQQGCVVGKHTLEDIFRSGNEMEELVVRWCRDCGAVVVDLDSDGRTFGREIKMKFPSILTLDAC